MPLNRSGLALHRMSWGTLLYTVCYLFDLRRKYETLQMSEVPGPVRQRDTALTRSTLVGARRTRATSLLTQRQSDVMKTVNHYSF